MISILSYLVEYCLEIFIDDFYIFVSSFDHCLTNLGKVLKRCREKHLTLNLKVLVYGEKGDCLKPCYF